MFQNVLDNTQTCPRAVISVQPTSQRNKHELPALVLVINSCNKGIVSESSAVNKFHQERRSALDQKDTTDVYANLRRTSPRIFVPRPCERFHVLVSQPFHSDFLKHSKDTTNLSIWFLLKEMMKMIVNHLLPSPKGDKDSPSQPLL